MTNFAIFTKKEKTKNSRGFGKSENRLESRELIVFVLAFRSIQTCALPSLNVVTYKTMWLRDS